MPFCKDETRDEFKKIIVETLQLRSEMIETMSFLALGTMADEDIFNLFKRTQRHPANHWKELREFKALPAAKRWESYINLVTHPLTVNLPPPHLDVMLLFCTEFPKKIEDFKVRLQDLTNRLYMTINVAKLLQFTQYKQGEGYAVELTESHVFGAVHAVVRRVYNLNGATSCLVAWMKEAKMTESLNSDMSYPNGETRSLDEALGSHQNSYGKRTLADILPSNDATGAGLEQAQDEIGFLHKLESFVKAKWISGALERSQVAYENCEYETITEIYEEALGQLTKTVSTLPLVKRKQIAQFLLSRSRKSPKIVTSAA
jgi:hypothetical protein